MSQPKTYTFKKLEQNKIENTGSNIELLKAVETKLNLTIGSSTIILADVLKLTNGSLLKIEGNNSQIEVDISIQGKSIGKGEVVLINDEPFIKVTKINQNKI